ncbi:MAG UNVERIFIED_CONTAM: hypothetical protein LVR29_21760 [Microcystis novacekii LVE1205-3]|jgi:maltooligosyltrehalose synthase
MKKLTVINNGKTSQWGSMFDVAWEHIQMHVNGQQGIMSIQVIQKIAC